MSQIDPKETLALPQPVDQLSLTTLREMLIEIGAKVVRHGRDITFQMADWVRAPHATVSLYEELMPFRYEENFAVILEGLRRPRAARPLRLPISGPHY